MLSNFQRKCSKEKESEEIPSLISTGKIKPLTCNLCLSSGDQPRFNAFHSWIKTRKLKRLILKAGPWSLASLQLSLTPWSLLTYFQLHVSFLFFPPQNPQHIAAAQGHLSASCPLRLEFSLDQLSASCSSAALANNCLLRLLLS